MGDRLPGGGGDAPADRVSTAPRAVRWAAALLTAACAAVLLWEIPTRFIINDDYQNLYTAWLQSLGQMPGRDFGAYSPQIVADLLVPVFRLAPETLAPLFAGRLLVLALLCLSAWLLVDWTRRHVGALAAVLVLPLVFACRAVLYRGLDLRPDPLILALWMWALWLLRAPVSGRPLRVVGLGAALVLMALVRIKSALMFPVVGAMLLWDVFADAGPGAARPRRAAAASARAAGWLGIGGVLGLLGFAAVLGSVERIEAFVANTRELIDVAASAIRYPSHEEAERVLRQSRSVDPLLWVAAPAGFVLRALRARRHTPRSNLLALCLAAVATGWVVLNPAFYAYNLVVLAFVAAPFAALALQEALGVVRRRIGGRGAAAVGALGVALIGVWAAPVAWQHVSTRSNAHQMGFHRFLLEATAPSDPVYAMEGLGLFRPSTFHFRMPAVVRGKYLHGDFDMGAELRARPPAVVVQSYRVPKWLREGPDRDFIEKGYVHLAPWLMVPGRHAEADSRGVRFDAPLGGRYEMLVREPLRPSPSPGDRAEGEPSDESSEADSDGRAGTGEAPWRRPEGAVCVLDSVARAHGETFALRAGRHVLDAPPDARCTVRRWYAPAHRALVANPGELPYLKAPGLSL